MGILDIFKKSSKADEEIRSAENKKEIKRGESIDINITEIDTLTGERCSELISHVLKDKDFGEEFIRASTVRENIFITVYMRNVLLKQFEGDKVNDLHDKFLETIELFESILFEKIMKLDKLWKIINKATGCSVIDNREEPILISDLYIDKMIEDLKNCGIIAEAVEINHDEFVNELKDLHRTGYKGIRFTDGRQSPCVLSIERLIDSKDVEQSKYPVNPEAHFSLVAYLQEFRRSTTNEEKSKILNILGRAMIANIINMKFIIPVQEIAENQFNLPIYRAAKNEEDEVSAIGLYVFTDEVEMKKLELTGLKLDHGWKVQVNEFKDVIDKVESCHISEICINFASTQFRLDKNTINSLKKDAKITSQADELKMKQEKFENEELPKIFDKDINIVRAPNGMPIFMREQNRVCIDNYLLNLFDRKNMFNDVMNSLVNDDNVKEIKVFDIQGRNADIKIKDDGIKRGLFIMPMRFDDENDQDKIEDDVLHYSINAAKIYTEINNNKGEVNQTSKSMHFFTIVNSATKKNYVPLFNDIDEAKKIFSNDMFRYCMVTFEEVKEKAEKFDGIVIGPTTLSAIVPKEFLDNMIDININ